MPNSKPTNVRWLIVAMLICIAFLGHFNRVSITVAGNERFISSDGMTEVQMGRVYSIFLLVYTIGMLPGGWLIDRFGPRFALTAMGIGLGLCGILTGLLGQVGLAIAALYLPLLLIRGLAGASSITLHPGAARTVSLWFPRMMRSSANGMVTAGALVGIALTYPVFGWLMDRLDWPGAFIVSGAAMTGVGIAWCILSADHPDQHRWANEAECALVSRDQSTPPRVRANMDEILALFRNRSLVLLTLSYGALSYVQYLFFYWMEYYFTKVLGLPTAESRHNSFIVTMAMAVGMACGGFAADRLCRSFGHRIGARIIAGGGMGLCALFGLFGIFTKDPTQIVWFFSLSFCALGLCEGVFWTSAPILAPRNGGLACALLNTGGNGVGMLAPVVTPILGKYYGWNSAIIAGSIVCSVGALLWLGIGSDSRREQVPPATQEEVDYDEPAV